MGRDDFTSDWHTAIERSAHWKLKKMVAPRQLEAAVEIVLREATRAYRYGWEEGRKAYANERADKSNGG